MRKIAFGQFLVLAFAIASILAFVTGVHGWQRDGSALRYHGVVKRLIALAAGAFCVAWFIGLRKHLLWTWYFGCAVLVLLVAQFFIVHAVITLFQKWGTFDGWWAFVSQTIVAVALFFVLTKWWIPKRREFQSISGA